MTGVLFCPLDGALQHTVLIPTHQKPLGTHTLPAPFVLGKQRHKIPVSFLLTRGKNAVTVRKKGVPLSFFDRLLQLLASAWQQPLLDIGAKRIGQCTQMPFHRRVALGQLANDPQDLTLPVAKSDLRFLWHKLHKKSPLTPRYVAARGDMQIGLDYPSSSAAAVLLHSQQQAFCFLQAELTTMPESIASAMTLGMTMR